MGGDEDLGLVGEEGAGVDELVEGAGGEGLEPGEGEPGGVGIVAGASDLGQDADEFFDEFLFAIVGGDGAGGGVGCGRGVEELAGE